MLRSQAFSVLQLPVTASEAEIRKAYRVLARYSHPDLGGSAEEFHRINQAYEFLLQPEQNLRSVLIHGETLFTYNSVQI